MPRKPPCIAKPATPSTANIWQVLIQSVRRSPSDAKKSLMNMRTIGLLNDIACEFLVAALGLGGE